VEKPVKAWKPKKEKRPKSKKEIILFSVLGAVVVLLGIYFGTYFAARSKARAWDYASAQKLLLVPAVTRLHDPKLEPYIHAGLLFDQGEYAKAEKAFDSLAQDNYLNAVEEKKYSTYYAGLEKIDNMNIDGYRDIETLAQEGFPLAVEALPGVKEVVYQKGIELYRQGSSISKYYFVELDSYRRSIDYLTLIDAKYNYVTNNYLSVVKLIGFEDADKIILDVYNEKFLKGTWKTSDGRYSFSMSKNGDTSYTLPYLEMSNSYYDIEDGIYYLYKKDVAIMLTGEYERKNVFRFTIIDANTINVYCYKDGSTHKLYRQ